MLYAKGKTDSDETVIVPIDVDNILNYCPRCGKEVRVDLAEFWNDDTFDFQESELLCEVCGEEYLKGDKNECKYT